MTNVTEAHFQVLSSKQGSETPDISNGKLILAIGRDFEGQPDKLGTILHICMQDHPRHELHHRVLDRQERYTDCEPFTKTPESILKALQREEYHLVEFFAMPALQPS